MQHPIRFKKESMIKALCLLLSFAFVLSGLYLPALADENYENGSVLRGWYVDAFWQNRLKDMAVVSSADEKIWKSR